MTTTTTNQGLTLPSLSDAANGPTAFTSYNTGVEARLVQRYLSTTDRTARNPTPSEAELCYILNLNRYEFYTGATWAPLAGTLAALLVQTSVQSMPNNAFTAITFNSETLDLLGAHDNSTNNSRYTPPVPGWYMFSGGVSFASNATGARAARWRKNGSDVDGADASVQALTAQSTSVTARVVPIQLNGSTDYVELVGYQLSGAALNTSATGPQSSTMVVVYSGLL